MIGGAITTPLPCIACGYNLEGLAEDAVCPECATPVRDSIERGLSFTRRRVLRRAATVIACATVFRFALLVGPPLWLAKHWTAGAPYPVTTPLSVVLAVCIVGLAANLADWCAWFVFTSPRGIGGLEPRWRRITIALRAAILAQPVLLVAFAIAALLEGDDAILAVALLTAVTRTTQLVMGLILVRVVARRIESPRLAQWAGAMILVIPAAMVVLWVQFEAVILGVALHTLTFAWLARRLYERRTPTP